MKTGVMVEFDFVTWPFKEGLRWTMIGKIFKHPELPDNEEKTRRTSPITKIDVERREVYTENTKYYLADSFNKDGLQKFVDYVEIKGGFLTSMKEAENYARPSNSN